MEKSGNSLVQPVKPPPWRNYGSAQERAEWGAYKGQIRGLLRGLLVGGVFGGVLALGIAPVVALIGGTALSLGALGTVCAGFSGIGALMGGNIFGKLGSLAGETASTCTEKELEQRYGSVRQDGSPEAPIPGLGHEYPVGDNKRKPIFWRVAIPAALLAGGVGLLIGIGAFPALAGMHLLGPMLGAEGLLAAASLKSVAMLVPAVAGAMYGFSYGINRAWFRKLFNHTDAILDGKPGGPDTDDIAKSHRQALALNQGHSPPVITSRQREVLQHHLQDEYYEKAFWGGLHGNMRGMGHWMTAGLLTGLAFAAITVGVLALTTGLGMTALLVIGAAVTAAGPVIGMHYAENGMVAGVGTAAGAHYEKRRQLLIEGKDPSLAEEPAPSKKLFNWRVAIPTTIIGAAFGAGTAAILGHGVVGLLGPVLAGAGAGTAEAAAHGAEVAAGATAEVVGQGATAAISTAAESVAGGILHGIMPTAVTFGMIGATMGMGPQPFLGLSRVADSIFNGAYYPRLEHEYQTEIVQKRVPLLSPDSYFQKLGEGCAMAESYKAAQAEPAFVQESAQPARSAVERFAADRAPQAFTDRARLTAGQDRMAAV